MFDLAQPLSKLLAFEVLLVAFVKALLLGGACLLRAIAARVRLLFVNEILRGGAHRICSEQCAVVVAFRKRVQFFEDVFLLQFKRGLDRAADDQFGSHAAACAGRTAAGSGEGGFSDPAFLDAKPDFHRISARPRDARVTISVDKRPGIHGILEPFERPPGNRSRSHTASSKGVATCLRQSIANFTGVFRNERRLDAAIGRFQDLCDVLPQVSDVVRGTFLCEFQHVFPGYLRCSDGAVVPDSAHWPDVQRRG